MNCGVLNRDLATDAEKLVWPELICRRGAEYAISIAELRRRTKLSERAVKDAVNGLRLRHLIPVGSSRGKKCGYYLIDNATEMERTVRSLRRQALSELHLIRVLMGRDQVRYRELLGQLVLEAKGT